MEHELDFEKTEASIRKRQRIIKAVTYVCLILWAAIVLFPFYWMVLTSLKSYGAYNAERIPRFFVWPPTFQNYRDAFTAVPLAGYLANTVIFTVITTALMIAVITLAAYAFARLRFPGRDLLFTLFLSLMMIPSELVVITNFATITGLELRNTFTGLILPSVTSVFYIYLLKENFEQVPEELYRAAKVDGTSDLKYLWKFPGVQRYSGDPGKRLRPGKYPGYDGGGRRNLPAFDSFIPGLPEKSHGGRIERRHQGMKTPAKKWSGLFLELALAAALTLTGCHGSRETSDFAVPETFDEAQSYEITFWAKNDTNKLQTDIYKKAIEDFQKLYPNITVNLRLYTNYGKIYNDVITNISTGTTPNVCITYPDHIATYLTGSKTVVPLDELFSDPEYGLGGSRLKFDGPTQDEIIPQFLKECSFGSYYYAVPYMRSTEACYINKTYVEALGYTLPETLTWDFIWEVSEAAAKKDENGIYALNGQDVMIPFIYKSTDNMMIQMLKQKQAGYSTAAGDIQIFNDTTKELLYTIADHVKTGAFSTFKISSYPANFLNAGQCVFAIDSTAGATWMGADAPLSDISEDAFVPFETEVLPIPQFDPENPSMISQGPSICIFNKEDSQEVLASWLFTQFLLSTFGFISYVVVMLATGRAKEIHPTVWHSVSFVQ